MTTPNQDQHSDVLIIGAGISGIGTACHLQRGCPERSVTIVERRDNLGGTWDLFRYPGIRSDSDMHSFSYKFRPWDRSQVLADGDSIREYLTDTAREHGLLDRIRYGLKITRAEWCSDAQRWTVSALRERTGETQTFTCRFLSNCTGYYNYDEGYRPQFPGEAQFAGEIVHPQHWPQDMDYSGKRVVIIGSGATAVTLVPNMADKARHVTMLQRSPSYILSVPAQNRLTGLAQKVLPARFAHQLTRQGYIAFQRSLYLASRHFPKTMRKALLGRVRRALGNDFDMRHFTPDYMPWDERLCAVPGGDMFKVLREGKASVVTDHIERFTETGIQLESGKVLDADIIVTATGLKLQMLGGMDLVVDGQPVDVGEQLTYKGVMLEAVPNMSWFFGYTNASWTLKADLAGEYLVRLFSYMDEHDLSVVTAQAGADQRTGNDILESLQSGYIERDRAALPRQGRSGAWKEQMHYGKDKTALLDEPIDDPALSFAPPRSADSVRPWSAAA